MSHEQLCPDSLYSRGYTSFSIPNHYAEILSNLLEQETWVEDPAGVYRSLPAWGNIDVALGDHVAIRERAAEAGLRAAIPPSYTAVINHILKDCHVMGQLLSIAPLKLHFTHAWDGAESLDWHWDGLASGDFVLLIYLSRHSYWDPKWGGCLSVGTRPLRGNFLRVQDKSVDALDQIMPVFGRAVLLNNSNPRFVHKVSELTSDRSRRTLMSSISLDRAATAIPQIS